MKAKWICCLVILSGLPLLLTSCWNSRELNELAIVSGIGIDKLPGKEEYRVTFQLVNPSATSSSTGPGKEQSTIAVYSANDNTLFGAMRKASRKVSRQLFFAHTQLVILGESMAESGIDHVFDIFERSHELRLNSAVLISRDTDAASMMKQLQRAETIPSIGIAKKNKNSSHLWGENRYVNVKELISGFTGEGGMTISGIRLIGDKEEGKKKSDLEQTESSANIVMSGLGVLKDGKLVGWLDGSEARGTLWLLDKIDETTLNIDSEEKKESTAVNIFTSETKVKVDVRDGVPVFHVHILEEGTVIETKDTLELSNREVIRKLEDNLKKITKEEVTQAFQAAQRMNTDVFNFGNELKRVDSDGWKSVGKDWDHAFAKGELDIHVEAFIRNTGMRLNPFLSSE
ncbi:Ger(x)C family spore germination protein [Paenibacillus sp. 7124]|uniref:Ger(X)C family spore germination protein n=2 Tax=Paenibacillus TaxID=44249 RepID=A0A6M1PGS5_9BACL|nr:MULTISPECIES: Ger(x)C family spore germination protein [Paenibacillus]AHV98312.1 germination protein, GerC family [Paenibacillus sabinae T27]NGM81704.1 Ger(x)C family spore germination protein [Paenibacillus apii]